MLHPLRRQRMAALHGVQEGQRRLTPSQKTLGRILRGLGFVRVNSGLDPIIYERDEPCGTRRLDVQLWAGEMNRVSSQVQGHGPLETHRRGSALPTGFVDGLTLLSAIAAQQVIEHPERGQ